MKKLPLNVFKPYKDYLYNINVRLSWCGKSQKDLADFLGVDPGNLSRYLSCVVEPGLSFYFKVENFFQLWPLNIN